MSTEDEHRRTGAGGLIRTSNLAIGFRRGRVVARDIDLVLGGGLTVVVGANGAGKSTLLRTLASALPAVRGTVELDGLDLGRRGDRRQARRLLGYVPQDRHFPQGFTVREFLRYGAALRGVVDSRAVDACIDQLGLQQIAGQRLATLSGGQRQKCFVAEATVHQPSILLMDEPTAGLDIPSRRALLEQMEQQPPDRCVVFTTHLVEDVSLRARHVVLIADHGVMHLGSGAEVATSAAAGGLDLGAHLALLFAEEGHRS